MSIYDGFGSGLFGVMICNLIIQLANVSTGPVESVVPFKLSVFVNHIFNVINYLMCMIMTFNGVNWGFRVWDNINNFVFREFGCGQPDSFLDGNQLSGKDTGVITKSVCISLDDVFFYL